MKHCGQDFIENAGSSEHGHLKVTFGVSSCFSEEFSWLEVRWRDHVAFVRGEHEGAVIAPPVHIDPERARALAIQLFEAGELDEPDVGRSTNGAVVRFEGDYAPRRGQSVSFRVELRASLLEEPSRRLAALGRIAGSFSGRA